LRVSTGVENLISVIGSGKYFVHRPISKILQLLTTAGNVGLSKAALQAMSRSFEIQLSVLRSLRRRRAITLILLVLGISGALSCAALLVLTTFGILQTQPTHLALVLPSGYQVSIVLVASIGGFQMFSVIALLSGYSIKKQDVLIATTAKGIEESAVTQERVIIASSAEQDSTPAAKRCEKILSQYATQLQAQRQLPQDAEALHTRIASTIKEGVSTIKEGMQEMKPILEMVREFRSPTSEKAPSELKKTGTG
jgi:hypothetical protein